MVLCEEATVWSADVLHAYRHSCTFSRLFCVFVIQICYCVWTLNFCVTLRRSSLLCCEVWRGSNSRSASEEADRADRTFYNSTARSVRPCSLWLSTDYSLSAYLENTKSAVVTTICTYLQSRPAFQSRGRLMTCLWSLKPPRTYLLCGTRRRMRKLLRCKYSEGWVPVTTSFIQVSK